MSALLATTTLLLALSSASISPKRGLCHVPSTQPARAGDDQIWINTPGAGLTWYYNYKYEPSDVYKNAKNMQYVPMLWGASETDTGTPFLDSVQRQISAGANITYVLGFNEPDGPGATGGSSVSPALAATQWIKQIEPLKKLGVKLGAPAVTGAPAGFTWLSDWLKACNGGCTPDFIPVHWYGNFEGLASHIGGVVQAYPNLTIWVTEFGYANQDLAATQNFYNQSIGMLDRWSNVTHYSYFGAFRSDVSNVGPNSAMLTEQGKLTDIGSWYMGGVATNNVPHTGSAAQLASFASWSLAVVAVSAWMLL